MAIMYGSVKLCLGFFNISCRFLSHLATSKVKYCILIQNHDIGSWCISVDVKSAVLLAIRLGFVHDTFHTSFVHQPKYTPWGLSQYERDVITM
jgi:hypothetical protein